MIERRIKELAIALEALSRIQADYSNYSGVNDLLNKAIKEAQEQNERLTPPPSPQLNTADDIPF